MFARFSIAFGPAVGAAEALRDRWVATHADDQGRPPKPDLQALAGIVVFAGALRFATLDARSFWVDEAVVVRLVHLGLWDMLDKLGSGAEGTPPLYYTLAWAWSQVFGSGEVGLRSLSALIGTATVPLAYVLGRRLVSSRVGLVAAMLFALSPVLVWHAQDARAHSLAVLLSGLSLLFFLRALREPRGRSLAAWAAFSALGIVTHYFVAFLVAVEALWLLLAFPRRRRAVWAAIGGVAVAAVGVLPIALAQKAQSVDNAAYDLYGSLFSRLATVPAQVLAGEQPPLQRTMPVLAAALIVPALVMAVRRTSSAERSGAAVAAVICGAAVLGMVVAAVAGFDYLIARNALPAFVPGLLLVACGFGALKATRGAYAALAGLCALWLVIDVTTAGVPKFEREDWRGAAAAIGPNVASRAIVVTPRPGRGPLLVYLPGSELMRSSAPVREIDVVGLAPSIRKVGRKPMPPRPASAPPAPGGFRQVERHDATYYTLIRFRSRRPLEVTPAELLQSRLSGDRGEALLQRASGARAQRP